MQPPYNIFFLLTYRFIDYDHTGRIHSSITSDVRHLFKYFDYKNGMVNNVFYFTENGFKGVHEYKQHYKIGSMLTSFSYRPCLFSINYFMLSRHYVGFSEIDDHYTESINITYKRLLCYRAQYSHLMHSTNITMKTL